MQTPLICMRQERHTIRSMMKAFKHCENVLSWENPGLPSKTVHSVSFRYPLPNRSRDSPALHCFDCERGILLSSPFADMTNVLTKILAAFLRAGPSKGQKILPESSRYKTNAGTCLPCAVSMTWVWVFVSAVQHDYHKYAFSRSF